MFQLVVILFLSFYSLTGLRTRRYYRLSSVLYEAFIITRLDLGLDPVYNCASSGSCCPVAKDPDMPDLLRRRETIMIW
ncbi:hypothetical protein C8R44DRAFT_221241 [Mycena epipterygia]|nr:hypothetical protein C8R44DRAFT_221241 [Mycena epipterygia]